MSDCGCNPAKLYIESRQQADLVFEPWLADPQLGPRISLASRKLFLVRADTSADKIRAGKSRSVS